MPSNRNRPPRPAYTPQGRAVKLILCLSALFTMMGCAKTTITSRNQLVTGQLPRPAHIWVYSFAATAADVPSDSALAGQVAAGDAAQTPEHLAMGRQLGAEIATELVNQIHTMGMPAAFGNKGTVPEINDIVIRGYLISFDEGSATKRVAIGFGSGASNLQAAAEGFQVTASGLRKLGSGTADAAGDKGPGANLGVVGLIATHNPAGLIIGGAANVYGEKSGKSTVTGRARQFATDIAAILKKRFQEQGWIN